MILLSSHIDNLERSAAVGAAWTEQMMSQIASRFQETDEPEFPCVFAQNAYQRGNILCLPVPFQPDTGSYQLDVLLDGLRAYLRSETEWDGSVNTARPLLVLFEPVPHLSATKDYENIFVEALQYLILFLGKVEHHRSQSRNIGLCASMASSFSLTSVIQKTSTGAAGISAMPWFL